MSHSEPTAVLKSRLESVGGSGNRCPQFPGPRSRRRFCSWRRRMAHGHLVRHPATAFFNLAGRRLLLHPAGPGRAGSVCGPQLALEPGRRGDAFGRVDRAARIVHGLRCREQLLSAGQGVRPQDFRAWSIAAAFRRILIFLCSNSLSFLNPGNSGMAILTNGPVRRGSVDGAFFAGPPRPARHAAGSLDAMSRR